jgi:hypothetical protein
VIVTDDELREMVRASIARLAASAQPLPETPASRAHPSFGQLPLTRGSETDGACLIEPAVRCTHCGYCLSYGH